MESVREGFEKSSVLWEILKISFSLTSWLVMTFFLVIEDKKTWKKITETLREEKVNENGRRAEHPGIDTKHKCKKLLFWQ